MSTSSLLDDVQHAPLGTAGSSDHAPAAAADARARPDLGAMAVLVVDDNAVTSLFVADMLTRWNARPSVVEDGRGAFRAVEAALAAADPYRVALVDTSLEAESGWALAFRMRRRPELAAMKLVMLDAGPTFGSAHPGAADACVTKPVREAELWSAIEAALGRGRQSPEDTTTLPGVRRRG